MLSEFIDFIDELFIYRGFDGEIEFELTPLEWLIFDIDNLDDIRASFVDDISGEAILFSASKITGEIDTDPQEKIITIKIPGLISKNWKSPYMRFDLLFVDSNQDLIPFPGVFEFNIVERITHG